MQENAEKKFLFIFDFWAILLALFAGKWCIINWGNIYMQFNWTCTAKKIC